MNEVSALNPRVWAAQTYWNQLAPPGCLSQKTPWRGWDDLGIGLSLGGKYPRLNLRNSIRLGGQGMWVYRQCQGASWSWDWNRCIQGSWVCWSSPASVKSSQTRWNNLPVQPEGTTTTWWLFSMWVWGFALARHWCDFGSSTSFENLHPAISSASVGGMSYFLPKPLELIQSWWGNKWRARWGHKD